MIIETYQTTEISETHPCKSISINPNPIPCPQSTSYSSSNSKYHSSKTHPTLSKSNILTRFGPIPKRHLTTTSTHTMTQQWLYQRFNNSRNNFAPYKRQTSSTTIPSTTINKNTIYNPKLNSKQCYYYHNTGNMDEQNHKMRVINVNVNVISMSMSILCQCQYQCQFSAITSSQWTEHLFTKEESDLDGQSLSNSFKWEPLHSRLLLFESRAQNRFNESSVYSTPAICHCQYTMKYAHSIVIIWAPNQKSTQLAYLTLVSNQLYTTSKSPNKNPSHFKNVKLQLIYSRIYVVQSNSKRQQ